MTTVQLHREFKIALDKADSSAFPELRDVEIDIYLNTAQEKFIKTRYGLNNIYKQGFEQIQKRTDDLKGLVKTKFVGLNPSNVYSLAGINKVYECSLTAMYDDKLLTIPSSDTYMLFIKAMANTCIGTCCDWEPISLIQQDDMGTISSDPFNNPSADDPKAFFENGNLFVWVSSDVTVSNAMVTFIKKPVSMNKGTYGGSVVNCELSEHTHREILQLAVQLALENLGSPRVQSQDGIIVQRQE